MKRILIIDDEELIVKSLRKLLEKNEYIVFVAKNGQDAVAMIEAEGFDLIIADIRMPGMNGVETIREIYKILRNDNQSTPPNIFITGYADATIQQEAESLNPVAFMYKPFDIDELLDKVKKVFQN